jgi:cytochrome P450
VLSASWAAASAAVRPPGPRGRPLAGTLYDYDKDPAGYLGWCRDTYGDIFSLTPYHVVVCRPEWSQRILARTGREFQFASNGKSPRESFMTHRVAEWLGARRTASRYLAGEAQAEIGVRLRAALEWLARLPSAGVADCQRAAAMAALPCYVHDGGDPLLRLIVDAEPTIQAITGSSLTLPRWASPARRRWLRATNELVGLLVRLVEARRAAHVGGARGDEPPRDVLDVLSRDQTLTSLQVAQFLATATANAHSVAGTALSWLLVQAARYPVVAALAGDPDWSQAVVKETLRMYPPIWGVRRQVTETAEIDGFTIGPGMTLVVSPRLMHYDPRWWRADPAAFRPERWLAEGQPHDSHAYIPYGAGPRVCSGAVVAQAILTAAASGVAASWRVIVDTPGTAPLPGSVVIPDPLRLRLLPR